MAGRKKVAERLLGPALNVTRPAGHLLRRLIDGRPVGRLRAESMNIRPAPLPLSI